MKSFEATSVFKDAAANFEKINQRETKCHELT
jgi:hypothetical protein